MVNPKVTADDFAKRLGTVTAQELADGLTTSQEDGACGIVLKVSARDWAYARIVLYHQITDKDVDYTIKKFEYVIKEFDRLLEWLDWQLDGRMSLTFKITTRGRDWRTNVDDTDIYR